MTSNVNISPSLHLHALYTPLYARLLLGGFGSIRRHHRRYEPGVHAPLGSSTARSCRRSTSPRRRASRIAGARYGQLAGVAAMSVYVRSSVVTR